MALVLPASGSKRRPASAAPPPPSPARALKRLRKSASELRVLAEEPAADEDDGEALRSPPTAPLPARRDGSSPVAADAAPPKDSASLDGDTHVMAASPSAIPRPLVGHSRDGHALVEGALAPALCATPQSLTLRTRCLCVRTGAAFDNPVYPYVHKMGNREYKREMHLLNIELVRRLARLCWANDHATQRVRRAAANRSRCKTGSRAPARASSCCLRDETLLERVRSPCRTASSAAERCRRRFGRWCSAGGTIKRLMEHLNPRGARVIALEKPSETEKARPPAPAGLAVWLLTRSSLARPRTGPVVLPALRAAPSHQGRDCLLRPLVVRRRTAGAGAPSALTSHRARAGTTAPASSA
jgi:hypothetical protein